MIKILIVATVLFSALLQDVIAQSSEQSSVENSEAYKTFKRWVNLAVLEARGLEASGKTANMDVSLKFFRNCVEAYEDLIKSGVSPTYSVRPDKWEPHWTGTVEEIRQKSCDPWLKKAGAMSTAQDAPYRKALKNDKLRIALDQRSVFLPGRVETEDPQKMAAAPVWFAHLIADNRCPNGSKVNTVRRYQFDGQHKLLRSTEQKFCGSPPSSAYH
jgi:hypothetical protein